MRIKQDTEDVEVAMEEDTMAATEVAAAAAEEVSEHS